MRPFYLLTDINECSSPETHDCSGVCANTIGSYTCGCGTGYKLAQDGLNCEGDLTMNGLFLLASTDQQSTKCLNWKEVK